MPFDATPTNTVADVLRRARALIDTPEKWLQCDNSSIMPSRADRFCAMSALAKISPRMDGDEPNSDFVAARTLLERVTGAHKVWLWNDAPERTHAEVLAAFTKAIALAEQAAS